MKKLITVVLLALSLTTIKISAAQERIYYNFTYGDGVYYDLDTGIAKSNERFAVTNRTRVMSDKIWIVGNNYHHIVWWGENNRYLGYHNSIKSSYKTNLFNAYETSYGDIDVIDNDSFVTRGTLYNSRIYNNDWVMDNIIPGVTYTMAYDVTLLYKPDTPTTSSVIAFFRLYDGASSIFFASIPHSQFLIWEVGETVHVENTIKIPVPGIDLDYDLSDYSFYFGSAYSPEWVFPIMRVDNVRLTVGDTIPTGQYFGTAGPFVTPPEGAKYFHLQVCKERDNLIDFIEYPPQGALDVIDKNSFKSDFETEVVYEDLDYGVAPRLILDYGRTYYIRYSLVKLAKDGGNGDDVGIFFWWPEGLTREDIGIDVGAPKSQFRLAPGISDDWFQPLPVGENAFVEGTFIADDLSWPGSPYHGRVPYPELYVYTTAHGASMIFDNIYILTADSYDAQIESISEDPVEVYERFRSTQVYYERDITEPPTGSLPERLDNWLGSVGLNNTFFKILLSVVLMTVVAISLALMHAPASVVIFGTVLVLALVAFFGWVPLWIIIMVALVLLLTTIFKLKGAGGGSAEDD